jgi:hypothetical protein
VMLTNWPPWTDYLDNVGSQGPPRSVKWLALPYISKRRQDFPRRMGTWPCFDDYEIWNFAIVLTAQGYIYIYIYIYTYV